MSDCPPGCLVNFYILHGGFVEVSDHYHTSGKFKRSERLKERQILSGEGDTGRIRSVQITMVQGTGRGDGCIKVNNIKA